MHKENTKATPDVRAYDEKIIIKIQSSLWYKQIFRKWYIASTWGGSSIPKNGAYMYCDAEKELLQRATLVTMEKPPFGLGKVSQRVMLEKNNGCKAMLENLIRTFPSEERKSHSVHGSSVSLGFTLTHAHKGIGILKNTSLVYLCNARLIVICL